jgi:acetyl-CoA carboxylase biotin carboxylase subunit
MDAESLHVKFADEAVCIGPRRNLSYLKCLTCRCNYNADAIHPGYGFYQKRNSQNVKNTE